jgi:tetratricopeptide (TPR) repeat protein
VERRGASPVLADLAALRDTTPERANVVVVTAYKLLQRGRRAEAIQVFEWAAERFSSLPQMPLALGILGEAYLQAGRRGDAVRVFEQAVARDPYDTRALEWLSWLGVRDRSIPGS